MQYLTSLGWTKLRVLLVGLFWGVYNFDQKQILNATFTPGAGARARTGSGAGVGVPDHEPGAATENEPAPQNGNTHMYCSIHCILVLLADLSQPRSNLIVYLHGTVSRDFSPLFFGRKTPYGPLIVWMYEDKLKQFQEIVRFREISRRYSILLHVLLTFVTDISDSIFWISFRQFYATLQ